MENIKEKVDLFRCGICGEILGEYEVHTEYFKLLEDNKKIGNLGGFICTNCIVMESGIKKLYHLSNKCDIIEEFVPRVPDSRAKDEEGETPRVSLSPTIEGALTAVPWGGMQLENELWDEGSFLIRVYEFDIEDLDINSLIPPQYLYSKNLVIDSRITKEHWYLKNLKPSRTYLIEIDSYNERVCDHVLFDDVVSGIYAEMDEDTYFNWENVIGGSFVEIQDVKYHLVPEERRSKVYRLDHEVEIFGGDEDKHRLSCEIKRKIFHEFTTTRTWVDIEDRDGKKYLIGELDTREIGELDKRSLHTRARIIADNSNELDD